MDELVIKVEGKEYRVTVEETESGKVRVHCGKDVYDLETHKDSDILYPDQIKGREYLEKGLLAVKAPLPGVISSVHVKPGDSIKKGTTIIKMMAMKMENDINAEKDAKVKDIKAKAGDRVNRGDLLMILE